VTIKISPSMLAADFGRLREETQKAEQAGADAIHLDVMDGRFVPNLTIGPVVVSAIRAATQLPLETHLMMVEPEKYIEAFAQAGSDLIWVHLEACPHLHRIIQSIKEVRNKQGVRAGVALNPHTSLEALRYVLPDLDSVLVMSVNPGFGGQRFLPSAVQKISDLRAEIQRQGLKIEIAVDGGIAQGTASQVVAAGARNLIAGSAVFGKEDYKGAIDAIRVDALRAL